METSICIEDPRAPERVQHGLAEMIRFRALLIVAGYEDANDCDAVRAGSAFKMAVGRLPENGPVLAADHLPAPAPHPSPRTLPYRAPPDPIRKPG